MGKTALLGLSIAFALAAACGGTDGGSGDAGGDAASGADALFGTNDAASSSSDGASAYACDGTCAAAGGQCAAGVCTLHDDAGKVAPADQTKLSGGGTSDPTFAYLYPYDETVWARGLLSPTLQLSGGVDAAYVHISCSTLDYEGFFGASSPARVTLAQPMWAAIMGAVKSSKESVKVEVTKLSGGKVTGPITETWYVAQGNLRGTIYYETYDSAMLGGSGSVGIMKIQPGAKSPTPVKQGCGNVCHTASADGSTLVAATSLGHSASYDLGNNAALLATAKGDMFTYGGLYPDGSFLLSATNYRTWATNEPSRLYDTKTGAYIPAPSWDGLVTNGGTTAFSPDGKKVAFVHEDEDKGHTLAVMDFDKTTKTFSNLVDVATDATRYVAWPAFTPDGKAIVYHAGSNARFETDNYATGDVFVVDLASKTVHRLDALDGYQGAGTQTYLPAKDPQLSFAPTVLPEAVGGYFWVVFTSHRSYGNTLPSQDNNDEYGKVWVSALDVGAAPGSDGSHPAFFLDGQELGADNLRGFWVLDPCRADGQGCESGDECCGGYCRGADGGAPVCVPPPGGCSHEYESCSSSSDCCDATDQCINGKCAAIVK